MEPVSVATVSPSLGTLPGITHFVTSICGMREDVVHVDCILRAPRLCHL